MLETRPSRRPTKLLLMYRTTQVHAGTEQRQAGTGIHLTGAVPRRGARPADSPLVPRRVAVCGGGDEATAGRRERRPGRAGVRPGRSASRRTVHLRRFQPTRNCWCHRSNWRHRYVVTWTDHVKLRTFLMKLHLRATWCHLSYWITQCYLPPTQVNIPCLNHSQIFYYV